MATVSLTIDGKKIKAPEGEKVLWAALDNEIYIPNLCAIREAEEPFAGCRLCFVEIEGVNEPVAACTEPVRNGMVVHTRTPRVDRIVRTAFELLITSCQGYCRACPKNRSCELQKIAAHSGFKLRVQRFRPIPRDLPIDSSSPLYVYDPNKCVLCGKCVWVCQERVKKGIIGFAHRGFKRIVTTFADEPMSRWMCGSCSECVSMCPVGALVFKDQKASR